MKKTASKSRVQGSEKSEKGNLIVISAPSGCGKTTIVDRLLKRHPDWVRSISVTTRPPRAGEKNGEDYFFVSTGDFHEMESRGELLESAKVFDNLYGTPRDFVAKKLKEGKNVLLAIDVQGTRKIKQSFSSGPVITIFILPPSVKVLRERLEGRNTESREEIDHRIEVAQDEIKEAGFYDFAVVNQNLEQSIADIESHIEKIQKERSPQ